MTRRRMPTVQTPKTPMPKAVIHFIDFMDFMAKENQGLFGQGFMQKCAGSGQEKCERIRSLHDKNT